MYPLKGLEDNNNNTVIKEFRAHTRIHEHDFISVKTEKGQTATIICLTCGSLYCRKCGKLLTITDQNYMQNNIYN
jgi:hypothetical protein